MVIFLQIPAAHQGAGDSGLSLLSGILTARPQLL